MPAITWGVYSVTLLIGSLQGLWVASLLFLAPNNRQANRALAALILAVVLLITPYTLGFAGFFDRFRWLNFAPFYWDLAFGPLVWLYVRQLGRQSLPRAWVWHLLPAGLEGAYYAVVWIAVPTALKEGFNDSFHVVWVMPALIMARYLSYAVYGVATLRDFSAYQRWLDQNSGMREEFRLRWLRRLLWLVAATLALQAGFTLFEVLVRDLPYREQFPLYVVFAVLIWLLGLEGWRHAGLPYPKMDLQEPEQAASAPSSAQQWQVLAAEWLKQIEAGGWWCEPELSLASVARRLGTNTNYLSRALNEGAGLSFSACINRLRIEAAKGRLATGSEAVLQIGLEVGFASKASFNRVFKAETGLTPTAYRQRARSVSLKS